MEQDPAPTPVGQLALVAKRVGEGLRWLGDNPQAVHRFLGDVRGRQSDEDTWRYLFDRVNGVTALSMQLGLVAEQRLAASRRGETASLLLGEAMADEEFHNDLAGAMEESTAAAVHRDQIVEGLRYFRAGQPHLAVPLLIQAIEGIFWAEAVRAGLIERNQKGKWKTSAQTSRSGRQIDGFENVIAIPEFNLDETFVRFLRAVVFGGDGNSFRHGTADGGFQLRAGFLIVALTGWLETQGLLDSREVICAAFQRAQRRIDDRSPVAVCWRSVPSTPAA